MTTPPRDDRVPLRLTILLGALASFGPLSIDMYLPALPALGTDLAASGPAVQLTLTACTVGLGLGQLVAGSLSDIYGRRRPLLVGVALYVVFSVACALAPTVWLLVLFRFLQALAGSAGIVISRAIARDLRSGAALARLFSLLMVVNGAAPVLAPLIGGQLTRFTSWRGVFVALALIGAVLLVASVLIAGETLPPERRSTGSLAQTLHAYRELLADRQFVLQVLTGALSFGVLFGYIAGSPFVLEEIHGMSPQLFSIVFGANALAIVLFSLTNRVLTPARATGAGLILLIAASGLVLLGGLSGGLLPVLIGFVLISGAFGSIAPNVVALAMSGHPESAGSAAALMGSTQFVIGGLVAPLAGLGTTTATPLGVLLVAVSVLAAAAGFLGLRRAGV